MANRDEAGANGPWVCVLYFNLEHEHILCLGKKWRGVRVNCVLCVSVCSISREVELARAWFLCASACVSVAALSPFLSRGVSSRGDALPVSPWWD